MECWRGSRAGGDNNNAYNSIVRSLKCPESPCGGYHSISQRLGGCIWRSSKIDGIGRDEYVDLNGAPNLLLRLYVKTWRLLFKAPSDAACEEGYADKHCIDSEVFGGHDTWTGMTLVRRGRDISSHPLMAGTRKRLSYMAVD
ncbi:uncharacterized protein BO96DRAFT_430966 [Aspergillus niger CBS 101883]|uniref:Uncharacterized protein n=2 Tax=Aspergillus niger TaxID=5061 RepID=A2QEG1_ASPNC|nr:uncharacterized protein BO96DRAFT_430966 [Aspergillus niger CBS 101883]XP_059605686.1 hypothetical protein An02g10950 [Aspergillus niger]PYH59860.1 hypothetical protein BO96DRAFT_430966 [Aspergillus niger CBS 101883]CAK48760.1 hypothetical protein An02g10950 [Aspergillus niger]